MQTIDEVLEHPQTKALDMLQTSPDGSMTLLGLPLSFDGVAPAVPPLPAAARGAHKGRDRKIRSRGPAAAGQG